MKDPMFTKEDKKKLVRAGIALAITLGVSFACNRLANKITKDMIEGK